MNKELIKPVRNKTFISEFCEKTGLEHHGHYILTDKDNILIPKDKEKYYKKGECTIVFDYDGDSSYPGETVEKREALATLFIAPPSLDVYHNLVYHIYSDDAEEKNPKALNPWVSEKEKIKLSEFIKMINEGKISFKVDKEFYRNKIEELKNEILVYEKILTK